MIILRQKVDRKHRTLTCSTRAAAIASAEIPCRSDARMSAPDSQSCVTIAMSPAAAAASTGVQPSRLGVVHVGGVFSVLSYFLYVSYVCPEPVLVNRRVACRVRMKPKHKQQPSDSFIGRALLSHTWRGSRPHRAQATSARRPTDRAKRSFFGVFPMFVPSLSW